MKDVRAPLRSFNLNLFMVLDALLRRRSAARAAEELGVTPSAVSHSLRELRQVLGDPLFVRRGAGLEPTSRAVEMHGDIRVALDALGGAIQRQAAFDPATASSRYVVATADEVAPTLIPALAARLRQQAPSLVLDVRLRRLSATEMLDAHDADLVLQLAGPQPSRILTQHLYSDTHLCLVREEHPGIRKRLTLTSFCKYPHVRVAPEGFGTSSIDRMLEARGVERDVQFYVQSFMMAPEIVSTTDAILTAPAAMAKAVAPRFGLRTFTPPIAFPSFSIELCWHRGRDDAGLAWLREQLLASASDYYSA